MTIRMRYAIAAAVLVLSFFSSAQGQLAVGDNLKMQGVASASFGYGGDFGEEVTSSNSLNFAGSGIFNGNYFSPKFLSFHVQPYYNQSRANSTYETVTDTSGVLSSAQIFSGSRFPGSISFDKTYNSLSSFGESSGAPLGSSGSSMGTTIAWSALLPDKPTFNVAFSTGSSVGQIVGTESENTSHYRTLNLSSSYDVAGFNIWAAYMRNHLNSDTPGFYLAENGFHTEASSDRLSFRVSHTLPMHGAFTADTSRSHVQNWFQDVTPGKDTVDTLNSSASINPTQKLGLSCSTSYTDNLSESFRQTVTPGSVELTDFGSGSHSVTLSGAASYSIFSNLYTTATVTHLRQYYFNQEYQSTYFNGTLAGTYRTPILGALTWSVSGIDTANQEGNSGMGFASSLNFNRHMLHWTVSAGMDYDQRVQTMLATYTTSSMRWRAQGNRRLGERWYWSLGTSIAHSGLTRAAGEGNRAETVSTSLSHRWWSASANYSHSSGTSVLTTSGLQPVTVVTPGLPDASLILFNASSYGFGLSATPKRKLHILANYSHAISSTSSVEANANDANSSLTSTLDYSLRAITIGAGYSRYMQQVTAAGGGRVVINTYYFGISRWFKLF